MMGKRTKQGFYFESTFDAPRPLILATDINDPAAVTSTINRVTNYLGERLKEEEGAGTGAFGPAFAADRIHGSVLDYERIKQQLVHVGAPVDFVGLVDKVLAEARRALDVACAYERPGTGGAGKALLAGSSTTGAQPWTTTDVPVNGARLYTTLTAEDLDELVREGGNNTEGA